MDELSGSIKLAVSAELARQYSSESSEFLGYLVTVLGSSMKDRFSVKEKGLFKKTLTGLTVDVDGGTLNLDLGPGKQIQPSYTRVVRGIALKTEELSMEEWIEILSDSMDRIATSSEKSRNALANLLNLPG